MDARCDSDARSVLPPVDQDERDRDTLAVDLENMFAHDAPAGIHLDPRYGKNLQFLTPRLHVQGDRATTEFALLRLRLAAGTVTQRARSTRIPEGPILWLSRHDRALSITASDVYRWQEASATPPLGYAPGAGTRCAERARGWPAQGTATTAGMG